MQRPIASFLVPAFVLVVLAACGDGSSDDPPPGNSVAEACTAYVNATRSRVERCRESDSILRAPEYTNYCAALLSAAGNGMSVATFTSCAKQLGELSCDLDARDLVGCQPTVGTLADGSACAGNLQCSSGYCKGGDIETDDLKCGQCASRLAVGATCGDSTEGKCDIHARCFREAPSGQTPPSPMTCAELTTANEGESCDSARKPIACAQGLSCVSSDGGQICRKLIAQGGACRSSVDTPCRGELVCISGTCQLKGTEGIACDSDIECAYGFTCHEKKCTAVAKLAEGQACGQPKSGEAPKRCGDGLLCMPKGASNGVCKPYKAKGAACEVAADDCTPFTVCMNGTCALVDATVCK